MADAVRKSVVISAVNLRKGGTLAVLRDCLSYLSSRPDLDVTAYVHSENLCHFDGIHYIEMPWCSRNWFARLWCEYFWLGHVSRHNPEPDLWLSLHDTTPNVRAKRQAVYCHTSFPFLKWHFRDILMDFKIPLFAMLTRYAYRIGARKNDYMVVQQDWFRKGICGMTGVPENRIIVAPPHFLTCSEYESVESSLPSFFYPATPDCHKNFETLCQAAAILEKELGKGRFKVVITLDGTENRYSKWLYSKWGNVDSIEFSGYLKKPVLMGWYKACSCLVFPSRIETWGLPISEFKPFGKPMILSDLSYAHETAEGSAKTAFFNPEDSSRLASLMKSVIEEKLEGFSSVPEFEIACPEAKSWEELFNILLK